MAPAWVLLACVLAASAWRYVAFQRAIPEAVGTNYGMPMRYSVEAARLARTAAGPLYVSNTDSEAGVFAYLLGQQKRFDGRYTLVLAPGAASYMADASLGFAYQRLSEMAARTGTVSTPSGRVAYGLFSAGQQTLGGFSPLDLGVAGAVRLTGIDTRALPDEVALAWQITDPHGNLPVDVRQFAHVVDGGGRVWSTNPDFRGYPRPYWAAGETVISDFRLGLPADIPTGGYWIETGFYEPISGQRVGNEARIGPVKIAGLSPAAGTAAPLATFSGQLALLGVRRTATGVTLRWKAISKPNRDYTVFVHVLDAHGQVVAQQDGPPRDGSYPTTLWAPGEVVDDPHPLAFTAEAGQRLELGLYTYPDLRRLPVDDQQADSVLVPMPAAS